VGLMAGLGFGLMYLPAMDIIEVYFDRQENPPLYQRDLPRSLLNENH
jgi:hypothetical protein